MEPLNRDFILMFQKLENQCRRRFDCKSGGVNRYIEEMEQVFFPEEERQQAWDADCGFLKYCCDTVERLRSERDAIGCSPDDVAFLVDFFDRIAENTDPLSLLQLEMAEQPPRFDDRPAAPVPPAAPVAPVMPMPSITNYYEPYVPPKKTGLYVKAGLVFVAVAVIGFLICRALL